MKSYDLEALLQHERTTVTIQKTSVENNDDAEWRRLKDKSILFVGLTILSILFLATIVFLFKNPSNSLAMNTAFGIGSAFAGYLLRGKSWFDEVEGRCINLYSLLSYDILIFQHIAKGFCYVSYFYRCCPGGRRFFTLANQYLCANGKFN